VIRSTESSPRWLLGVTFAAATAAVRRGPVVGAGPLFVEGRGCSRLGGAPAGAALFEVAKEEPLSWLPAVRERREAAGELTAVWVDGEGGASALHRLEDPRTGLGCRPTVTEAGPRCASPVDTVRDQGRLDEACQRLAVLDYGVPSLAAVEGRGGAIHHFRPAPYGTPAARRTDEGRCVVDEDPSYGRRTLYIGEPYPPPAWPKVSFEAVAGPRLEVRMARATSGEPLDPMDRPPTEALFYDRARGVDCFAGWLDDELRCVPSPPNGVRLAPRAFADPRCQGDPLVEVSGGEAPPEVLTVPGAAGPAGFPTVEVREVGPPPETVYVRDRGCLEAVGATPNLYRLGRDAGDDWAPLERVRA